MWYGIAGLNALEILNVGQRKILYLADALTWLVPSVMNDIEICNIQGYMKRLDMEHTSNPSLA